MIARAVVRAVSRIPGVASDLADWYDEMHEIAEAAQRQRVIDEGADPRDKRDPARWVQRPDQRRPAPKGHRHDAH